MKARNTAYQSLLSEFNTRLLALDYARQLYEPTTAHRFTTFNWIDLEENRLSRILAYFLNPAGGHGQGRLFLETFVSMVNSHIQRDVRLNNYNQVVVETEAVTANLDANNRIDILVTLRSQAGISFGIGIENKIWAHDQPKQLESYVTELETRFGPDNYLLIYLTPFEREMVEHTIASAKRKALEGTALIALTYDEHFVAKTARSNRLFAQWMHYCQAERVRWFLKDINDYFLQHILQESAMADTEELVKLIKERNNLAPALAELFFAAKPAVEQLVYGKVKQFAESF
ncbi:MAG: PD-(D/E)XK nuclease family protein, partial [Bacteroidota bacterium]